MTQAKSNYRQGVEDSTLDVLDSKGEWFLVVDEDMIPQDSILAKSWFDARAAASIKYPGLRVIRARTRA